MKYNNTVIKVLNKEHGAKVIQFWKEQGVDTKHYNGSVYKDGTNSFIYYGVINNVFTNYTIQDVKFKNATIIELPKEKPKQEFPQLGTKEFNNLASAYFGGQPKQYTLEEETLEEAIERLESEWGVLGDDFSNGFYEAIKWQQEQDKNKYSEEEVFDLMNEYAEDVVGGCNLRAKKWFEQFKNK